MRCGALGAEHRQDECPVWELIPRTLLALVGCHGSEVEQVDYTGLSFLTCKISPMPSLRGC